jgi:hypothetical protein
MLSSHFIYEYAECHYAECHHADCHYAECHYAECCIVDRYSVDFSDLLSTISRAKCYKTFYIHNLLMFVTGAHPRMEHMKSTSLGVGCGLTRKH